MLKLNTSYSKKVPVEGQEYSSQSFHASVEVELSDGMTAEQIKTRIHDTFELVRQSVESELNGKASTGNGQQSPPVQTAVNHNGNGGAKARAQLDRDGPRLNFAQMAQGMGVHAVRASTAKDFTQALEYALATPGPHLIEALVPESLAGAKRRVLPWLLRSLPKLPQPVAQALKRKIAP